MGENGNNGDGRDPRRRTASELFVVPDVLKDAQRLADEADGLDLANARRSFRDSMMQELKDTVGHMERLRTEVRESAHSSEMEALVVRMRGAIARIETANNQG